MNSPRRPNSAPSRATNLATNRKSTVRIVGGVWKRSVLNVIDAEGLRPTPDRVRETVFNWLNFLFDLHWSEKSCLDAFAGSGALGFEAASRGAKSVYLVEANREALRHLQVFKDKCQATQCQIFSGDVSLKMHRWIEEGIRFDLIFLDPPFGKDWLEKCLPMSKLLLNPKAYLYVESELDLEVQQAEGKIWLQDWKIVRADKAGSVYFHLLQCSTPCEDV